MKTKAKIDSHHSNYTAKNTIKRKWPTLGDPIERLGRAKSRLILNSKNLGKMENITLVHIYKS